MGSDSSMSKRVQSAWTQTDDTEDKDTEEQRAQWKQQTIFKQEFQPLQRMSSKKYVLPKKTHRDSNALLKYKFQKLHLTVVRSVNADDVIDFLFQEGVIGNTDMRTLQAQKKDRPEQCSNLLALLHASEHPQAFVQLYQAIKKESHLNWLVDRIDEFIDQQLKDAVQKEYLSDSRVGQVVHTLPQGPPVAVWGITSLEDEIYVLTDKECEEVEVYDVITYQLLRCLTVPDSRGFADITSCEHYRCVYIADYIIEYVYRLDAQGAATQWPVNNEPAGLSVNKAHNVVITCPVVQKIKEFSSDGKLLRELILPDDVVTPWHAIQLTSGQFIVCHGNRCDEVNRVCMISADGRHIVRSHGGQRGSNTGQYNGAAHLAVDDNEFVFAVDINNRRVTLLSPTLDYIRQAATQDKLQWWPHHLHLDVRRQRLYVAETEGQGVSFTRSRVVVFSV